MRHCQDFIGVPVVLGAVLVDVENSQPVGIVVYKTVDGDWRVVEVGGLRNTVQSLTGGDVWVASSLLHCQ